MNRIYLFGWGAFFSSLSQALLSYGWIGLFVIGVLDSTFVPMPSGPDVLLVAGVVLDSSLWNILKFVLAATLGSTLGCIILYGLAKQAGTKALRRVSEQRREYIRKLLGKYDLLAVVGACVMPPPFPFKPFILCSGVFGFNLKRLVVGLLIGRTLRYTILALLARSFGQATLQLVRQHGSSVLLVVVVVIAATIGVKYLLARRQRISRQAA
ncbi:MAG: VTT domain-containing protein [Acidobacteriota bacterium]|nr:VTT domain-containing protein [Blastocatellia bacterium]MDW8412209.1 VTT domain-containing protein [Acidobacteriota bacterium]